MHKSETSLNLFARYEVENPVKLFFFYGRKNLLALFFSKSVKKSYLSYVYCERCISVRPNWTMKWPNIAPIQSKSQRNQCEF